MHLKIYNKNSLWRKNIWPSSSAYSILHFFQENVTNWKHSIAIFWRYWKVIRKMFVKKQEKPTHPPLVIHQMFECFVITLLKWMKYKNRLTFAYYSITFWDFKSFQGVPKTWKVLKSTNRIFKKMFKYWNTVYYDCKSRFLVIFSSNYRHCLVLEIPFSGHIFPKISKYRTKNLHFPSTGKYYSPPNDANRINKKITFKENVVLRSYISKIKNKLIF